MRPLLWREKAWIGVSSERLNPRSIGVRDSRIENVLTESPPRQLYDRRRHPSASHLPRRLGTLNSEEVDE